MRERLEHILLCRDHPTLGDLRQLNADGAEQRCDVQRAGDLPLPLPFTDGLVDLCESNLVPLDDRHRIGLTVLLGLLEGELVPDESSDLWIVGNDLDLLLGFSN